MRLRVKAGDEPCSSKQALQPQQLSPASPIGRIAKRNANLLSGFDLKNGTAYVEAQVGTIPDLQIHPLCESVPSLKRVLAGELDTDARGGDLLLDMQRQLEAFLASNIDVQKSLYGEVKYLQTGDYPTVDLANRPMPIYGVRNQVKNDVDNTDNETPRRRPSKSTVDAQPPGSSKSATEDDDVLSDTASSVNGEAEYEYNVLDVPHRFWTWAREYTGHISSQTLETMEAELFHPYRPENMDDFFANEPYKHRRKMNTPTKNGNSVLIANGSKKNQNNGTPATANEDVKQNGCALKYDQPQLTDLIKKLIKAYMSEHHNKSSSPPSSDANGSTPQRKSREPLKSMCTMAIHKRKSSEPIAPIEKKRRKSSATFNESSNVFKNGIKSDMMDEELELTDDTVQDMIKVLAACVGPVSGVSDGDDEDTRDSVWDKKSNSKEKENGDVCPALADLSMNEPDEYVKVDVEGESLNPHEWDEVSQELYKAQKRLELLVKQSNPLLNRCKKLLEVHHSYYVTQRDLNLADAELFSKTESLIRHREPTSEGMCLEAWSKRQNAFLRHNIRDYAGLWNSLKSGLVINAVGAGNVEEDDASEFSNELDDALGSP